MLRLIVDGKLRHGGDPLLRWCASNAAAKIDPAGNIKLDKERSAHRIDPIQALAMAVDGWLRRGGEPRKSAYAGAASWWSCRWAGSKRRAAGPTFELRESWSRDTRP